MYHYFHKNISSTVFNTGNKYQISIRMISERSCDTEDCSYDDENLALPSLQNNTIT